MPSRPRFPVSSLTSIIDERPRYNLAGSYPANLTWQELVELGALDRLGDRSLGYGTSNGNVRLREQIAASVSAHPDDVVVTVGAAGAILSTLFAATQPGDHVVTVTPNYPPTLEGISALGAESSLVPLAFDEGYRLPLGRLAEALSSRTALVLLVSPGNPSGVSVPRREMEEAFALIRSRSPGARIVIDETFRRASFDAAGPPPSSITWDADVLTIESLSKGHGAPGLRIGWVVCRDRELGQRIGAAKTGTAISCGAVDEVLATLILDHEASILESRRRPLMVARRRVSDWVAQHGEVIEWVEPDAGALCCVRVRESVAEAPNVADAFAEKGVKVAPGSLFGDSERVFRLGFGGVTEVALGEALEAMGEVLNEVSVVAE